MKHLSEIPAKLMKAAPLAVALMLGSCSLMHDDLPDCAVAPSVCAAVNFIYDYNTEEADQFKDNVGSVTLYVFDNNGNLVKFIEHTASANDLQADGYSMPLELPAGTYRLYASARQSADGYEASLAGQGAKFRRSDMPPGTRDGDITYTLDNAEGFVVNEGLPLEQFWLTHQSQMLELPIPETPAEGEPQPDDIVVTATIPLQRVSNNINMQITRGADVAPASIKSGNASSKAYQVAKGDYEIWIDTRDGRHELDLYANPTAASKALTYHPYSIEEATTDDGNSCLNAVITTSRLVHSADTSDRDMLYIRSKASGKVFSFDLTTYLGQGKDAYGKGWSTQEYLDRAYDFNIAVEFNEDDTDWRYVEISVQMLNWAKRIQNVDL